jgi:hypothetical protein
LIFSGNNWLLFSWHFFGWLFFGRRLFGSFFSLRRGNFFFGLLLLLSEVTEGIVEGCDESSVVKSELSGVVGFAFIV